MEKTYFQSKKCLVFTAMLSSTVILLGAGFFLGVDKSVLEALVTTMGATTGLAGVTLIGGQSFVDGKVRPAKIAAEFSSK